MTFDFQYVANSIDMSRIASPHSDRRYFVSVGGRRQDIDLELYNAGEPVSFPPTISIQTALNSNSTSILTTGAQTLAASGMVCVDPGMPNAGWYYYGSRTDYTLLGIVLISGSSNHAVGARLNTWSPVTHLLTAKPTVTQTKVDGLLTWSASLQGRGYVETLFPPDRAVLIEETVTPHGQFLSWSPRTIVGIGYVRDWNVVGNHNYEGLWSATVECEYTYLDKAPTDPASFGVVDLARGKSVTASEELQNPLLELDEWQGAIGTTTPDNLTDEEIGDPYISEITPTITVETPAASPAETFIIDEVYAGGPSGSNERLQYIMLRLPPGSPYFNEEGIPLNSGDYGFFLTTRQTLFNQRPYPDWSPIAYANYIRLPEVTLTSNAPRLCLCKDRAVFEDYWKTSGNDEMTVVEWDELPGFGNDQFPARNVLLRAAGDFIHIRFRRASHKEYVHDMVAWGDAISPWAAGYPAQDQAVSGAQWDDPATVVAIPAGKSIRRKPTCLDTNTHNDWAVENFPVPTDDRAETDSVHTSIDLGEFDVKTAEAMTASEPATGENLILTDATWLPPVGELYIAGERIPYHGRDDTTVFNIVRGFAGTTAAVHALGSQVEIINQAALLDGVLPAGYVGMVQMKYGTWLPQVSTSAPQLVAIENELVRYNYRTIDGMGYYISERGVMGTTDVTHNPGVLVRMSNGLGHHRMNSFSSIEWVRSRRTFLTYINIPGIPFPSPVWYPIVPARVEWWISQETSPRLPESDPDWENDWVGQAPIAIYNNNNPALGMFTTTLTRNYIQQARHSMLIIRRMSDEGVDGYTGRVKLNQIRVPREGRASVPTFSNAIGAGGPLIAMLSRYLNLNLIEIQGGTFANTSATMTFASSTIGDILRDYYKNYGVNFDFQMDGKLKIYKDPYDPLSPVPPIAAKLYRWMWRDNYPTNFPTRLAVGQVVVKITNPDTDETIEARYPPQAGRNGVEKYEVRRTGLNASHAMTLAQGFYRRNPAIARSFEIITTGPAPWLRPNMRLIMEDVAHGLNRRPRWVDIMVTDVIHNDQPSGTERFKAFETRYL